MKVSGSQHHLEDSFGYRLHQKNRRLDAQPLTSRVDPPFQFLPQGGCVQNQLELRDPFRAAMFGYAGKASLLETLRSEAFKSRKFEWVDETSCELFEFGSNRRCSIR